MPRVNQPNEVMAQRILIQTIDRLVTS